jgi:hypothetical protein
MKRIESAMVKSAKPHLDESQIADLRYLVRLTVEFRDYLEHGSVRIATALFRSPTAKDVSVVGYLAEVESASKDPFNKYDLKYLCNSIRSGIDSFCVLNQAYRIVGDSESTVEWDIVSSSELLKDRFVVLFDKFAKRRNFEFRLRLLLDLFKLQMVFAVIRC